MLVWHAETDYLLICMLLHNFDLLRRLIFHKFQRGRVDTVTFTCWRRTILAWIWEKVFDFFFINLQKKIKKVCFQCEISSGVNFVTPSTNVQIILSIFTSNTWPKCALQLEHLTSVLGRPFPVIINNKFPPFIYFYSFIHFMANNNNKNIGKCYKDQETDRIKDIWKESINFETNRNQQMTHSLIQI